MDHTATQAGVSMFLQADMQSKETRSASLRLGGLHLSDRLFMNVTGVDGGKPQATLPDK